MTESERLETGIAEVARMADEALKSIKKEGYKEERDYETAKKITAKALTLIDPQKQYGTELYNEIARLGLNPCIEAVCPKKDEEGFKVYLAKRADDDPAYPGQWHCPGSVFRVGENENDVLNRLVRKEYKIPLTCAMEIGPLNIVDEARGHFRSNVFLVFPEKIEGLSINETHNWFPVDQLPDPMVKSHQEKIIPLAVSQYENAVGQKIIKLNQHKTEDRILWTIG